MMRIHTTKRPGHRGVRASGGERPARLSSLRRWSAFVLGFALLLGAAPVPSAFAKTTPAGQTVGTVLFYVTNAKGEDILVSRLPVSEMDADLRAGKVDATVRNYSVLDKFVTTVHQEGQGFTVPNFIDYAKGRSTLANLRVLPLSFSGRTAVQFWEIDQTGYDDPDAYTYADLYDTPRYNFPLLYRYWDYAKQDYCDPAGKLTRAQAIDAIFAGGQPETAILCVRAFSQRYMATNEKYGVDYNMEGYWNERSLLDNERTLRFMKPMTKDELYNKTPTAMDSRYWVANIRLRPENAPDIASLGRVAAPTAVLTEAGENYYARFSCETAGATVLYNHNFISPSYTPTSPYGDSAVVIPKSLFPSGTVTMTARAVKDGYTDAGVVTLTLRASGTEQNPESGGTVAADVKPGAWYADAARYVTDKGLFDLTAQNNFSPEAPMTRAMLVTALYRLEASPTSDFASFSDVAKGTPLSAAVGWAASAGVVTGMDDGRFAPDAQITREQIAAMLCRYAAHKGRSTNAAGGLSAFSDAASVSAYARAPLAWANENKLVNGMGDGTVNPRGTATRAQVAQILLNYSKI